VIGRSKHAAWLHGRRAGRRSAGVVEFAELS
jgi:hypothetical protein